MEKRDSAAGLSATQLIDRRIAELRDWRGRTLSRMREHIKEADPEVVGEWKWTGRRRGTSGMRRRILRSEGN